LYSIELKAKEEELTADKITTLHQKESMPILTWLKPKTINLLILSQNKYLYKSKCVDYLYKFDLQIAK
jgi:hypothetical protein